MPENYYDDGPQGEPPASDNSSKGSMSESGEQTYLLPKSVLMGKDFKVGEEVVLKITGMHDDSIEVAYATEKGDGKGEDYGEEGKQPAPEEMPMHEGDPEMNSMYG